LSASGRVGLGGPSLDRLLSEPERQTSYGMNFEAIPELRWEYGYAVALMLMVLSAVLPYRWFKWRGWL
jgi:hypothetical protein